MRLETAIYNFIQSKIEAASENAPLEGCELKESLYGEVKAIKTIRIGDAQSEPDLTGDGTVLEFDGFLTVQVLVKPEKATTDAQIEAANVAHEVAMEISKQIFQNDTLNGAVCDCAVERKQNGWGNIATTRYAASYLLLAFNKRTPGEY